MAPRKNRPTTPPSDLDGTENPHSRPVAARSRAKRARPCRTAEAPASGPEGAFPNDQSAGPPPDSPLASLEQLEAAPYNPRRLSDLALAGLRHSLDTFGDLAGITWNRRTGHLVAGHQRLRALREQYGDTLRLDPAGPRLLAPGGRSWPVRIVDWDLAMEQAANVAANNPHLAGEFTEGLGALLEGIRAEMTPELFSALRFAEIDLPAPADLERSPLEDSGGDLADDAGPVERADSEISVGPFRWRVSHEAFATWREGLIHEFGADDASIIAALSRRLGFPEGAVRRIGR